MRKVCEVYLVSSSATDERGVELTFPVSQYEMIDAFEQIHTKSPGDVYWQVDEFHCFDYGQPRGLRPAARADSGTETGADTGTADGDVKSACRSRRSSYFRISISRSTGTPRTSDTSRSRPTVGLQTAVSTRCK